MTSDKPASAAALASAETPPWWGSIGLLWLMFVPLCAVLYTLCLPIAPNDFWYHARAGAWIAEHGAVPTADHFSQSWPNQPYFYQSWLAECVFYQVLKNAGLAGIVVLRTLCVGTAFIVLLAATLRRARRCPSPGAGAAATSQAASIRCAALAVLLTFVMAVSNMDVRPQMFSLLFFALFVAALFEWPFASSRGRIVISATLAVLLIAWANTHGAFFTGVLAIGALFVGEVLHILLHWLRPAAIGSWWGATQRGSATLLGALLAVAAAAPLFNPRGVQIYPYLLLLTNNETNKRFIMEWKPPSLDQYFSVLFFMSPLLILAAAVVSWRRSRIDTGQNQGEPGTAPQVGRFGIRLSELVLLAALFFMATRGVRYIVWYAIYLAPILSALCFVASAAGSGRKTRVKDGIDSTVEGRESPAPPERATYYVNAVLATLLAVSFVPLLPWFKHRLPFPPEFRAQFAPNPRGSFPYGFSSDPPLLLDRATPVEAAELLRRSPPDGKLFNDMVSGSYLTWALYPELLPYTDPRIELRSTAFWEDFAKLMQGKPDAGRTLRERGFGRALLDTKLQKALVKSLKASGWREESRSGRSVLLSAH